MVISSIDNASTTATSRGTKIVKPGETMDKNAFLRILTAELSNQDPTNAKDSTAYVAQMAQFSSLEQMANLNTTMTMSSANSMIGKSVTLKTTDSNGVPYYGVLRAVSKSGSDVTVGVEVTASNGTKTIEEFNYTDINGLYDNASTTSNISSSTLNLLAASNMIGKNGEFSDKDTDGNNLTGLITGIIKNASGFNLNVLLDKTGETKELSADNIIKLLSGSAK